MIAAGARIGRDDLQRLQAREPRRAQVLRELRREGRAPLSRVRAAVREASRFCDGCGAPLGQSAPAPAATPPASPASIADHLEQRFAGYTPRHLADKILTSRAALEGERKLVSVLSPTAPDSPRSRRASTRRICTP
jgi:hypothetical protein